MESHNTTNTSDLLVKLARLEDQVSTLSSQLELNKILIGQLKQSLSDRDLQISELEAKLSTAQISLQKITLDKINQCREQIKKGMDVNLINPVLTQIRKYIELIEGLVAEAGAFIGSKKVQVQDNFNATSNFIQRCPSYAQAYFEKNLLAPANAIVKKTMQSADNSYKVGMDRLEQELLKPGKALFDRIVFVARELPLNARLILQTRVLDPALVYVDNMPGYINEVGAGIVARLKQLIKQIRHLIQQCLDFIEEQIKKSQFWDGKHRMRAA
jgi:hypothetical protein